MKQICTLTAGCSLVAATLLAQPSYQFDFRSGPPPEGWTRVAATNVYSSAAGFGFEPGAELTDMDGVSSPKPFLFSVKLPEGNYTVRVLLNGPAGGAVTTVKSEQRRLMLEKISIRPGSTASYSFIVNVRTPRISASEKGKAIEPYQPNAPTTNP